MHFAITISLSFPLLIEHDLNEEISVNESDDFAEHVDDFYSYFQNEIIKLLKVINERRFESLDNFKVIMQAQSFFFCKTPQKINQFSCILSNFPIIDIHT